MKQIKQIGCLKFKWHVCLLFKYAKTSFSNFPYFIGAAKCFPLLDAPNDVGTIHVLCFKIGGKLNRTNNYNFSTFWIFVRYHFLCVHNLRFRANPIARS